MARISACDNREIETARGEKAIVALARANIYNLLASAYAEPPSERIAGSIIAIHVGNVYGSFTKLIYFLACLIATTLPITGTMIWLNKMKKKGKEKPKPIQIKKLQEALT